MFVIIVTFMFHKIVWRHIYSVVKYIIITLLQIVCRVCQ